MMVHGRIKATEDRKMVEWNPHENPAQLSNPRIINRANNWKEKLRTEPGVLRIINAQDNKPEQPQEEAEEEDVSP